MKRTFVVISIALITACGTTSKLGAPSQADADRGAGKYPGYSLVKLNEGKALYEEYCGMCHGLKDPRSESEQEWNKIVPVMVAKANKKIGQEAVTEAKKQLILEYVVTMSSAPASPAPAK